MDEHTLFNAIKNASSVDRANRIANWFMMRVNLPREEWDALQDRVTKAIVKYHKDEINRLMEEDK